MLGTENCDDGVLGDMIGCYDDCSGPLPYFNCFLSLTRNSICTSVCGDGVKTPNEGCDDGNSI